jgi:hypothetical protein
VCTHSLSPRSRSRLVHGTASPVLNDALARGRGKAAAAVLARSYEHLAHLVGTATAIPACRPIAEVEADRVAQCHRKGIVEWRFPGGSFEQPLMTVWGSERADIRQRLPREKRQARASSSTLCVISTAAVRVVN